ncbi:hypothetical protein AM232_08305 [Bacillus sp. FJAT-21352]|nr:hypothetical protein AM232_08305 [Bacillus sp. FJAT-21352]
MADSRRKGSGFLKSAVMISRTNCRLISHRIMFETSLSFKFFSPIILIGWKKIATLLPKYWLAETPQALVPRRLGRQSAEKERISGISWNVF